MRTAIPVLIVGFVAAAAVATGWWFSSAGPTGFRDVRWGASETELRRWVVIVGCYPADPAVDRFGTMYCRAAREVRIGNVQPNGLLFYLRDGHGLVAWRLAYTLEDRAVMRRALEARYGPPTERSDDRLVWRGRAGIIEVARDGYQEIAVGVSRDEMARLMKPERDAVERAAKGL